MSGPESIPSAVDKILEKLDWANISDERTRQCIRLLLNLVETLNAELQKARAENQCLREQGQGRKGGGGPGSGDASGAAGRSSEKERRERSEAGERSPRRKRSKLDRIPIGREEVLKGGPGHPSARRRVQGL